MCHKLETQDLNNTLGNAKVHKEHKLHKGDRVKHVIEENQDMAFVENVKVLQRILRGRAYQIIVRKNDTFYGCLLSQQRIS